MLKHYIYIPITMSKIPPGLLTLVLPIPAVKLTVKRLEAIVRSNPKLRLRDREANPIIPLSTSFREPRRIKEPVSSGKLHWIIRNPALKQAKGPLPMRDEVPLRELAGPLGEDERVKT